MVRIGLIGCGAAGMNHLGYMLNTPDLQVGAVCDVNPEYVERAAKRAGAPGYTDAAEMMDREPLDAVAVIATAHAHYKLARLAAERKLHTLIEKPLTVVSKEGWELVKAFRKAKRLLAVTYTYRFVDETRRMKDLIARGTIGELVELRHIAWGGFPAPYPAGTEARVKFDRLYEPDIRGILFDCGIHTFDLFRWLSGQKYVKFVGLGACHQGYAYPDSGTVLCEMTGGVRALYDHGSLPYYLGGEDGICLGMMAAAGRKGSLVWKIVAGKTGKGYISEFQVNTRRGAKITTGPLFSKCRDLEYREFVKSVRAGRLLGHFPTPEEAAQATDDANAAVDAVMKNLIRAKRRK